LLSINKLESIRGLSVVNEVKRITAEEVLEYLSEPHTCKEVVQHFKSTTVGSKLSKLFKKGLVVRSKPIKIERGPKKYFYLNSKKLKGPACFVPQTGRSLKFFTYEIWHRNHSFREHKLKQEKVLEYLEKVKAATAQEVAKHLNVSRRHATDMLHRLAKDGKVLRRGRMNKFWREVKLPNVGFVYGVDYDAMAEKLRALQESERVFPALSRVMNRIDADSKLGELTPEQIFRESPFNIHSSTLGKVVKYLDQHEDYRVVSFGVNNIFYNEKLILEAITVEELNDKIKKWKEGIERRFNVRTLSGFALEIVILRALALWKEFDHIETNVYIPRYNPYGRELDFVALARFPSVSEKVLPRVYVGEIKLRHVSAELVQKFYDKVRCAKFVKLKVGEIGLAEELDVEVEKKLKLSVWTLKGYVIPIFIGASFADKAIKKCYELGVIWIYTDDLLQLLGKKLRRRITANRIMKLTEKWIKEEGAIGGSIKDVKKKLEKFLRKELGI
jgi:predicted transcriptional regulator